MKLYFAPGACSLASHIALNAAGLPFDRVKVDLKAKTTDAGEDFKAINPKGYVPALELDDGEVLTENIAVLSYIGGMAPALFPAEGMPHWRTLETLAFVSTELHKNFAPFFNPAADEAARDAARKTLSQRFDLIEAQLGRPPVRRRRGAERRRLLSVRDLVLGQREGQARACPSGLRAITSACALSPR